MKFDPRRPTPELDAAASALYEHAGYKTYGDEWQKEMRDWRNVSAATKQSFLEDAARMLEVQDVYNKVKMAAVRAAKAA